MDTGLELIMSIKQRLVAEDEENGRKGYVLDSKDDFSDGESVNLDVWEDRYNIEWRTELDLEEFHKALGEVEGVSPEIDVVAYFAGDEGLEKVELEYQELADHEVPIKEFGNVHYSSSGFDLIWEDTAGSNTVELTQYGSDEIFEPVYSDTALSGSPESSQISSWLSQNLNE